MISWEEARRRVIEAARRQALARPRSDEAVPLAGAAGRVLAVDVRVDRDLPPFDRVTRDGFAVRAADVAAPPVELAVVGEVRAGAAWESTLAAGQAVEIMTGAPLPAGADAVVMVEDTERVEGGAARVRVRRAVAPGENVVPTGAEARRGDVAFAAGARLDPPALALLATVGCAAPRVRRPPLVAIVPTGDELVEVEATPGPAQIRNSNGISLAAQTERAGGRARARRAAADDAGALRGAIEEALAEADVLVLSGGVSMGRYDLVEQVLSELGAELLFDAVAIRPGKPAVAGRVRDRLFFGLPGNPLSTMVTFELFARPAIELLAGVAEPRLPLARVPLAAEHRQKALPLAVFAPAALEGDGADVRARPLGTQGSGDLAAMARAAGWIVIPPGTTALAAGELAAFLPR